MPGRDGVVAGTPETMCTGAEDARGDDRVEADQGGHGEGRGCDDDGERSRHARRFIHPVCCRS